jgi:hypothetical protein
MIAATTFAHSYSSFWKECFPALESYVRLINSGAYSRAFDEQPWPIDSSRNFLISEVSFCLVKAGDNGADIGFAYQQARSRLSGLPGVPDDDLPLTDKEAKVVTDLAYRMKIMLRTAADKNAVMAFDPIFSGCGILAKSYGDVLAGQLLIEMKCVDRGFRATDFRQLMTYVFQDLASGYSDIQYIAILNARRGIFHKARVEQFVYDTSAASIMDVQNKFLAAVGFGGVSR